LVDFLVIGVTDRVPRRLTGQEIAMPDAELQLAVRAARGDSAALEVLYRRHVNRVWRYAWLRTHSRDDAAEIVQETFLRVTRSIAQFKGQSTFTTWLFAVARSVAVELARREGRNRALIDRSAVLRLVPQTHEPQGSMAGQETRERVRWALGQLPGAKRDVVVLCELSGLSVKEAADVLQWSESRVKVTLFRARRDLRDRLKEYVANGPARSLRDRDS
jgi:RNA polymerase sigma-70 factor (ECF subfamily)